MCGVRRIAILPSSYLITWTDWTFLAGSEVADKVSILHQAKRPFSRQGFEWQMITLIGRRFQISRALGPIVR